jgi:hypothetical protein
VASGNSIGQPSASPWNTNCIADPHERAIRRGSLGRPAKASNCARFVHAAPLSIRSPPLRSVFQLNISAASDDSSVNICFGLVVTNQVAIGDPTSFRLAVSRAILDA